MLFSEPKIPQYYYLIAVRRNFWVSVLFSEPKIPQFDEQPHRVQYPQHLFQCSSASRKFLNTALAGANDARCGGFSALQRAENSSIPQCRRRQASPGRFQCSSASRKFLNRPQCRASQDAVRCFSALQRAENSSICRSFNRSLSSSIVSVLFSEPKIPQFAAFGDKEPRPRVSVLFSEPKIPQYRVAQQRRRTIAAVSVLFSEPKIPQWTRRGWCAISKQSFQCSSASRKFLNLSDAQITHVDVSRVSVLFSEPKIPQ